MRILRVPGKVYTSCILRQRLIRYGKAKVANEQAGFRAGIDGMRGAMGQRFVIRQLTEKYFEKIYPSIYPTL